MKPNALIFTIIISLLLIACSSSEESSTSSETEEKEMPLAGNPIVGNWEVIDVDGPLKNSNMGQTYFFKEDGSFEIGGFKGEITAINDSLITLSYKGSSSENSFQYRFEGPQLV